MWFGQVARQLTRSPAEVQVASGKAGAILAVAGTRAHGQAPVRPVLRVTGVPPRSRGRVPPPVPPDQDIRVREAELPAVRPLLLGDREVPV